MIRLLARFLRPYRWRVLIVVTLVAIQALANLYLPSLNADIINNGVVRGDTGYILQTGGRMLQVTFGLGVCSIVAVYFAAMTAMAFGRDVRGAIFRQVMRFSQKETNLFGTPTLITRNTNDVQQVQMLVFMGLNMMILPPIMAVGGVIMAMREDVPLSGTLIVIIPVVVAVVGTLATRALPLFRTMQKRTDRINQVMGETLSGTRVIRAFVRTDHEAKRFDAANQELTDTALEVNRMFAVMMPFLIGIMNLSAVAVVWFGGLRIDSGGMPIGNLSAFLLYMIQILLSLVMGVIVAVMLPRAAAAAERIQAVLDTEPDLCDPDEPVETDGFRGLVAFQGVEFRYPGAAAAVLSGIDFTALPGEITAIVGGTGSGKTTLVNLIPRFYDVTSGSVSIDGVDVRQMRQEDLWRLIGVVPQKAYLFSGTVASNLRYGDESAGDDALWKALETAQARDFVAEMGGQLEAAIDQGGTNVSGGQRQRLAIARAIVKRPRVYIFDDSFSALDFRTDQRLRAALRPETRDATVIIVAQRVGTIMHADQIVVLDGGQIVGKGTHEQLMETCQTYREIVYSQLTPEEAA
ncbi:MAG: ABC transporter ATP-binding protein [Candidatus Limnocylindrales bacterium]|jgi:ATP-binding cassette subfamily B protein